MKERLIFFLITLIIPCATIAQDSDYRPFSVANSLLSDTETVNFKYTKHGDTLTIRGVVRMTGMTRSQITQLKVEKKLGSEYLQGPRMFDGKILVHKLGDYQFIIRNDSIYRLKLVSTLSPDSLNSLFGRNDSAKNFNANKLKSNLKIILANRKLKKQFIYHKSIFNKQKFHYFPQNDTCDNSIKLEREWVDNGIKYYSIVVDYPCSEYSGEEYYIIDENLEIRALKRKFVDERLSNSVIVRPYSQYYRITH